MSKIVFITGATAGFGEACADIFAAHSYDLIINGRRSERLNKMSEALTKKYGVRILKLPFDVRQEKEVFSAIRSLPDEWRSIDILVNNAGLAAGRDYFEEADMDDWNTMIDTNIKGFLYVAKAVAEGMAARKRGHIINLGSIAGRQVYEKGNVYCATKYAVEALGQSMRIDLLRHGIKVTNINPGAAETEFSLVRFKGDEKTAKKVYEGLEPLTGKDVAGIIYYCATLPPHVCINDLSITCVQQADTLHYYRKAVL